MTVRRAAPADSGAIAAMLTRFNAEFDTWVPALTDLHRRLALMLSGQNAYAVLAEAPEPEGFALVTLRPSPYYDGPVATLDEMYISPERRGQGLGSDVIGLVLHQARERGCGEVQINVDEGDVDTRRFYEQHGFTNHEPGDSGDSGDTERMLCYTQDLR